MRKKSGYTLTELTIAVVIIGILAAIALPNYARSIERARCASALSTLKSIRSAAILYYRENNTFTGITLPVLETLSGAWFYSDGSNPHWTFTLTVNSATDFDVTAARLSGMRNGQNITFSFDEQYSGSYDYIDPGGW